MVECQRQGDVVAVLPRLELAAVDVVAANASAKSYAQHTLRLLRLPRKLGGLRRGLNGLSGRGSGRFRTEVHVSYVPPLQERPLVAWLLESSKVPSLRVPCGCAATLWIMP